MPDGDTVRALDHPYRRTILRLLQSGRMTYSDLFSRLEPNGGERARFNYHLRSLRNADLVQLTDSLYGLTPRGEAALVLLREVSERSGARHRPKWGSRLEERGWVRRVGDALRARTAEVRAIIPFGWLLLLVGSILLLGSYALPWLMATGYDSGTYSGIMLSGHLASHLFYSYGFLTAVAWFAWVPSLILVAVFAITSALVGRRFLWLGTSGIIILALGALLVLVVPDRLHFGTVSFTHGFTLAVIGCTLIEAGARLKAPAALVSPLRTPRPLGILLVGLGIASMVGGAFALPPGPRGLSSPIPGILVVGVGIVSTAGGFFALKSRTMAPPSAGITLMVLGALSAVGGFLGFLYGHYPHLDLYLVVMIFGVAMFVVGTVSRVRQSIASRRARPALSLSGVEGSGSGGRRQRQIRQRHSRRRAESPMASRPAPPSGSP